MWTVTDAAGVVLADHAAGLDAVAAVADDRLRRATVWLDAYLPALRDGLAPAECPGPAGEGLRAAGPYPGGMHSPHHWSGGACVVCGRREVIH